MNTNIHLQRTSSNTLSGKYYSEIYKTRRYIKLEERKKCAVDTIKYSDIIFVQRRASETVFVLTSYKDADITQGRLLHSLGPLLFPPFKKML